jgi:hypothetical protein
LKRYFFLFGLLCAAPMLFAQINVQAALSQNRILIGDKTQLNLEIQYSFGYDIEAIIPDGIKQTGLEFAMPQNENYWENHKQMGTGTIYKTSISLQGFEPDTLEVPAIPILYSHDGKIDTAFTPSLMLTIFPVLPDSTGAAPIKDIIREPKSFEDYYLYLALALLILIGIGLGYYFYQKKMRKTMKVSDVYNGTPSERALRKLHYLEEKRLWQQGKHDDFCTELSYVLRLFLEEEYDIQALENPTSYTIEDLEFLNLATTESSKWQELLRTCDAVKFANITIENSFYENAIAQAKSLIHG